MKKSYEKPQVAKVKLAADEAVLGHCKAVPRDPLVGDVCIQDDGTQQTATIGS